MVEIETSVFYVRIKKGHFYVKNSVNDLSVP